MATIAAPDLIGATYGDGVSPEIMKTSEQWLSAMIESSGSVGWHERCSVDGAALLRGEEGEQCGVTLRERGLRSGHRATECEHGGRCDAVVAEEVPG